MQVQPNTVPRSQLTTIHMVAGGEKRHPVVVDGDRVKEWIGFGWIDIGQAGDSDRLQFPTVEDL
jgi:hypothetical protein